MFSVAREAAMQPNIDRCWDQFAQADSVGVQAVRHAGLRGEVSGVFGDHAGRQVEIPR